MSFAIAGTVLTVGATAYSANRAQAAARSQSQSADAASAEAARQYDQTRTDYMPQMQLGQGATNALARLQGFGLSGTEGSFDPAAYLRENPDVAASSWASQNPEQHFRQFGQAEGRGGNFTGGTAAVAPGAPDTSGFFASPDYNFRRQEGTRGLERTAASRGGAFSGNALRALAEFNSGLASQEYGNYFNRLTTQAGLGTSATNAVSNAGADASAQTQRNALIGGDARASGITNQANIIGQGVNGLAGIAGYYGKSKYGSLDYMPEYQTFGAASRRK